MSNAIILHDSVDTNRHSIEKQNEILKQVTMDLYNSENRLNIVDTEINYLACYLELESMFDSIDEILNDLEDIERDGRFGRCNEKGLNPHFLVEQLRKIETNKNGIAPIFASWEYERYYSHEMCAIALHNDELWVTLRIPIINLAEQFVRAVPTSNQHWIVNTLSEFGIAASLFKDRLHDKFMMVTQSSFETCSVLGTARVCNIRMSKFSESNPFVIPIDIGHSRILVISNSSTPIEMSASCDSQIKLIRVDENAIIRLPESCFVKTKSFEIDVKKSNEQVTQMVNVGRVENVSVKKVKNLSKTAKLLIVGNLTTIHANSIFELNNNQTIEELQSITTRSESNVIKLVWWTGGGIGIAIALTVAMYVTVRCISCSCKKRVVQDHIDERGQVDESLIEIEKQKKAMNESVQMESNNTQSLDRKLSKESLFRK